MTQLLILLAAAVVAVPLSRRLGLGPVLGYLAAGVVVGPVLRLVSDPEEVFEAAELGVVFFLFIIGLELKPARLWAMRRDIFGLGLAQVVVTGLVLTFGLWALGYLIEPAVILGFGLAMSSTALGMQALSDTRALSRPHGERAFAILLFQDIAIVPLLALVPLLAPAPPAGAEVAAREPLAQLLIMAGSLGFVYLAGRYLLNPMFRVIARADAREVMTAAALLVVLIAAEATELAGMSLAMGAFFAGLLLADSSYRHELEANIEPFRGLLLGLFFMAVGLTMSLDIVLYSWWRLLIAVPVIMLTKGLILYGLSRLFGATHRDALRVAALLAQAGEFAFVLFASASEIRALWPSHTAFIAAAVTVSMALTPLVVRFAERFVREEPDASLDEDFEGAGGPVLLIGFGRFGQVVAQVLLSSGVDVTILDGNADRIRQAARAGFRIYFGDGTRRDVLRSAGADQAAVICVCSGDRAVTDRIVAVIEAEGFGAAVHARAQDRAHSLALRRAGVAFDIRETFESALVFAGAAMRGIGRDAEETATALADTRRRDADRMALDLARRRSPTADGTGARLDESALRAEEAPGRG